MLVPFCAGSPALGRHEPRKVPRARVRLIGTEPGFHTLLPIEVPHVTHFAAPSSAHEAAPDKRWWGLGVICVAMFISAMDMTIVNVALPDMSNDLDAGIGELQWVLRSGCAGSPSRGGRGRPRSTSPAWRSPPSR